MSNKNEILNYLQEAMNLEYNVSILYQEFALLFEQDYEFWIKLSIEEKNHAGILKTALKFADVNLFPDDFIYDTNDLAKTNILIKQYIIDIKEKPDRKRCFEIAIELENSAGESHYQNIIGKDNENKIIKILHKLNKEDINHLERIKNYSKDFITLK